MMENNNDTCCQIFGKEFQRSKFSLYHEERGVFCRSQWQQGDRSILWLIYRWLFAAFFGICMIMSVVETFYGGRWFIYLTDWGFTLCTYTAIYGAVITTIYYFRPFYFAPNSCALKIYWASHFTSTVLAFMITLVFWSAVYPSLPDDMGDDVYSFLEHASNSVLMLLDLFMVAYPARLMHLIYPVIVLTIYCLFSLIYYCTGGTDILGNHFIYEILDWEKPGLAIGSICGCLILVICLSTLVFWLYRFRIWMHKSCVKPKMEMR
ncbi:protein rolling stone-like [Drosophila tropicalis]|uniref:protein rolling stone-like n=1 Tax=Drosophila tropicalis TaxID=46794 RepID=UPI0035AB879B